MTYCKRGTEEEERAKPVHVPPTPDGVMLPAALFPIIESDCACYSFLRKLGFESPAEMNRYLERFCDVCFMCTDVLMSKRARHIAKDRIPVFVRKDGSLRPPWEEVNPRVLERSVYVEEGRR